MKLYRITATKYASDLSGTGGLYGPGRWHREGTRMLDLAERVSLAKLKVLANSRVIPANQSLVTVEISETASITAVEADALPAGWSTTPYLEEYSRYCRALDQRAEILGACHRSILRLNSITCSSRCIPNTLRLGCSALNRTASTPDSGNRPVIAFIFAFSLAKAKKIADDFRNHPL